MRVCVIFNPAARGLKARKFAGFLGTLTNDCHCKPTAAAGEARSLAAQAVHDGFDTIIAAGGDGTLNEVLNGIGDVPEGFSKTRLGVLPLGTVNVFARELKIPMNPKTAWEIILRGNEIYIDLPQAEFQSAGKSVSRYFAQLAGAGLDSKAVAMVNWELKKKIGPLAYVVAGFRALQMPQTKITLSSPEVSVEAESVLIGNGKLYGGSFVVFPKAELRDGLFDVCAFPKVNWTTLLRAGAGFVSRDMLCACGAKQLQMSAATLTANQQTFLQLDGENVGELPAKLFIHPKRLRILVP